MIVKLNTTTFQLYLKIKTVAECIFSPLTFINTLIEESQFSCQWEIVCISPIPKVTNPKALQDYRPIPILLLSKMYEKLVLLKIADFIETQEVYNKYQSG